MNTLTPANVSIESRSRVATDGVEWGMAHTDAGLRLVALLSRAESCRLADFEGETSEVGGRLLFVGPLSARNAAALRRQLAWLIPRPLGLRTSVGLGDRLGLATPGHVRALRAVGGGLAPIFAQQSVREMTRTGRTPQQVLDAATWGAFEEGWVECVGADADHLKVPADVDAALAAGYTFFTIDPGAHVDERVESASPADLRAAVTELPWTALEDDEAAMRARYLGRTFDVEGHGIRFDEGVLLTAAVKYGRAVAHVASMSRHLTAAARGRAVELEVSVDETEKPTTPGEHLYFATELRRLGVEWVSLAPRFTGRFEKGVDYIGDVSAFETDLAVHAAIARQMGPYKLSLHSGSDKFNIYRAAVRQTRGLVHLKTAGTSYLEALRAIARVAPDLFRAIYGLARQRYEADRVSYHVSACVARAPRPETMADDELPTLLDQFDARQILHVTFGSVLTARDADGRSRFAEPLLALLQSHRDVYAECLEAHFVRHLAPFAA
jgi:hypothetical protein